MIGQSCNGCPFLEDCGYQSPSGDASFACPMSKLDHNDEMEARMFKEDPDGNQTANS